MIVLLIITLIYFIFIVGLIVSFKRLKEYPNLNEDELGGVTIVIAFRNEEENLLQLLDSITNQKYPKNLIELILINDHSTDDGLMVVKKKLDSSNLNFQLINLEDSIGKKAAIESGVIKANNDFILTTDADCKMSKNWVVSMYTSYMKQSAVLLLGPVELESDASLISQMQKFEFSSIIALTAGLVAVKRPIMSNGANLAFSKKVFLAVQPYKENKEQLSGDDVFSYMS